MLVYSESTRVPCEEAGHTAHELAVRTQPEIDDLTV